MGRQINGKSWSTQNNEEREVIWSIEAQIREEPEVIRSIERNSSKLTNTNR